MYVNWNLTSVQYHAACDHNPQAHYIIYNVSGTDATTVGWLPSSIDMSLLSE